MDINFKELFKNIICRENDILYCESRFRKLESDFKEKKYDFRGHSLNTLNKDILQVYLEYYGYSYVANKLKEHNNKGDIRFIAKLLLDSNLVSSPKILLKGEESNNIDLKYLKREGIYKEYKFIYDSNDFPLFIDTIAYDNTGCISCTRDSSNSLSVIVNIVKEEKVNQIENIVVYTSLGIHTISITIRSNEEKYEIFGLSALGDFFKLCNTHTEKALEIYMDASFDNWIRVNASINQLISYEESIEKGKILKSDILGFKHFCISNGIFIANEESDKDDKNNTEKETQSISISENRSYNKNVYASDLIASSNIHKEDTVEKETLINNCSKKEIELDNQVSKGVEESILDEKEHRGLFSRLREKIFGSKKKGV